MRILVLGYIVRGPLGGLAWHHLQYVMGLHKLGHDVYFIEDSDDYESCYDPTLGCMSKNPAYGLRFAQRAFESVGLPECWTYHDAHTSTWMGPCAGRALELFSTADLLLNVSGVNPIREWMRQPRWRVLIDTDPVFTQVRHLHNEPARMAAASHTSFFSFGENIGHEECSVPADGFAWLPTRQPVVLEAWPLTLGPVMGAFTTVMQWDSYSPVEHAGRCYGMKSRSFESYLDLPARVTSRMKLALGSATAPRPALGSNGWEIEDPLEVTRTLGSYQRFIQDSKAEFSVAKHGYVVSHSGWFSERSAAYLASGRPVVTQDTGFSRWIETGTGLLGFDSPESAVDAICRINRDYSQHCRRARDVAAAYFEAGSVLGSLLERASAPGEDT